MMCTLSLRRATGSQTFFTASERLEHAGSFTSSGCPTLLRLRQECLPQAQLRLNIDVHDALGLTPGYLLWHLKRGSTQEFVSRSLSARGYSSKTLEAGLSPFIKHNGVGEGGVR